MQKDFKVISILDNHSIAIGISAEEADNLNIRAGSDAYIVAKEIEITDPDTHKKLGNYTMMMGENPIYIISGEKGEIDE